MASRIARYRPFLTHPANGIVAAIALALLPLAWPALATRAGLFALALGIAIFPAQEYVTHRFVLHAPPARSAFVRRLQERLHYGHHREPERVDLLFGPLWSTLPTAALYALAGYWLAGDARVVAAFSFAQFAAYFAYEWMHFVAHAPIVPRTPWGRWMKRFHLAHHYKNERFWYGVTTPAVDALVGTNPRVEAVPESPTARDLFALTRSEDRATPRDPSR